MEPQNEVFPDSCALHRFLWFVSVIELHDARAVVVANNVKKIAINNRYIDDSNRSERTLAQVSDRCEEKCEGTAQVTNTRWERESLDTFKVIRSRRVGT